MPIAVHYICPACDAPTVGANVVPEARVVVCDLCGARSRFDPLPPLLFVTGASGAGKSTLYRALLGQVDEAILIDADLLWGINPAHDDPPSSYRAFRGLTLHLAERIARNGTAVVIEGTCMPDQYEQLGERWFFSRTAYLAVTCDETELRQRLAARPAWRKSASIVEDMVRLNEHFQREAQAFEPPMRLLDTTGRSVSDCAEELHHWIRAEVSQTSA